MQQKDVLTATTGALATVDDFEAQARARLPADVFDYIAGGSGREWTLRENLRAYGRWVLRPRVLVDVSSVDLQTTVLGQPVTMPILLAPTSFHRLAHPDGEAATARAAKEAGTIMAVSTLSTVTIEDIAAVGAARWFQLYVMEDRDLTAGLVRRAHSAGYGALVLTADAPLLGRRLRDERNSFTLPPGIGLANLEGAGLPPAEGSALSSFFQARHDASVSWEDIEWLRSLSPLPIVLKGVLTAEDAGLAVDAGAEAVIVSNHGGRQLDGAPASLDALPEVVDAVAGRTEVLVDGGIRRGEDVLKALALGARAVLVGRPYLWGLAVDGTAGALRVLEILRAELALAMALVGRASVSSVDGSLVAPATR
jgi:4-hydroxymandelate oxidase